MTVRLDIAYGSNPGQKLDVYQPAKPGAPVVVFWHGGSWKSGDKRRYGFVGRRMASLGYMAVLPNYRLYPEVKYPGFIEDSALALDWAATNAGRFGGDPAKLFVAGHSAGAYNAAMMAMDWTFSKATLKGFIGLSGPYDFYPRPDLRPIFPVRDTGRQWLPITHASRQTVPSLLIHGQLDYIVRAGNSRRLARAITDCGGQTRLIIYPHLEHFGTVAPLLPGLSWLAPVQRHIQQFINRQL